MRLAADQAATRRPSGYRVTAARGRRGQPLPSRGPLGLPRAAPRGRKMSTEDEPKKLSEDDPQATPTWHRARAQRLRKNGFMKMALEHEQIAQMLVRQQEQQTKYQVRPRTEDAHRELPRARTSGCPGGSQRPA